MPGAILSGGKKDFNDLQHLVEWVAGKVAVNRVRHKGSVNLIGASGGLQIGEPHGKPQHVMWHYMNGKTAASRVDDPREKVRA
jgi:hypothetical protein